MLRADLISPESQALLASVARVVLVGRRGSLADQLGAPQPEAARRPAHGKRARPAASELAGVAARRRAWSIFNGLGGFAEAAANT